MAWRASVTVQAGWRGTRVIQSPLLDSKRESDAWRRGATDGALAVPGVRFGTSTMWEVPTTWDVPTETEVTG